MTTKKKMKKTTTTTKLPESTQLNSIQHHNGSKQHLTLTADYSLATASSQLLLLKLLYFTLLVHFFEIHTLANFSGCHVKIPSFDHSLSRFLHLFQECASKG